jgi:hypothetical protein
MPSLAPMIKRVSPAVVNIGTAARSRSAARTQSAARRSVLPPLLRRAARRQGPRERPFQSAGSGVIIDAKAGHIVTNAHVVENASEITVTLQDGRDLAGRSRRQRRAVRRRAAEGQAGEPDADRARRFGSARGRRFRRGDRQPVRTAAHRHVGHRQRPRPHRHQRGQLREFHPDRCLDQSRQFGRRAREPARRTDRHQQRDPVAQRRQHRHRLRDPDQHGAQRAGSADPLRLGEARAARREHRARHARTSRRRWALPDGGGRPGHAGGGEFGRREGRHPRRRRDHGRERPRR